MEVVVVEVEVEVEVDVEEEVVLEPDVVLEPEVDVWVVYKCHSTIHHPELLVQ